MHGRCSVSRCCARVQLSSFEHQPDFLTCGPFVAIGSIRVVQADGTVCFQHAVDTGDIWRMCQTKDAPIKDWVRLAVDRARATGDKTIFYLDEARAHDASLIAKINTYIKDHDTSGLDISILPPAAAMTATCASVCGVCLYTHC